MRILCIGGGPAGLYLAILLKKADPRHAIRVVERNRPVRHVRLGRRVLRQDDGQSRSRRPRDRALRSPARSTTGTTSTSISAARTITSGGHGFCGIGRKRLLNILQERCEALGVELVFETDVADDVPRRANTTPISSSPRDGLNSRIRTRYLDAFAPDVDLRRCRFVWLGTQKAVRRVHVRVRSRPSTAGSRRTPTNTIATRRRSSSRRPRRFGRGAGLERMSQEEGIAYCERLFAPLARRRAAAVQCHASARLGDMDPIPARRLPVVGALEPARRATRARSS